MELLKAVVYGIKYTVLEIHDTGILCAGNYGGSPIFYNWTSVYSLTARGEYFPISHLEDKLDMAAIALILRDMCINEKSYHSHRMDKLCVHCGQSTMTVSTRIPMNEGDIGYVYVICDRCYKRIAEREIKWPKRHHAGRLWREATAAAAEERDAKERAMEMLRSSKKDSGSLTLPPPPSQRLFAVEPKKPSLLARAKQLAKEVYEAFTDANFY